MTNAEVFTKFQEACLVKDEIECWFPNGKDSIRVRLKGFGDLIFTYISKKKWRLETVESWLSDRRVDVL